MHDLIYVSPLCFHLLAWADGTWSSRDPTSKPRNVQQSNEELQARNGKTWSWFCEFLTYYIKKESVRIFKNNNAVIQATERVFLNQCERWVLLVSCCIYGQMKTKLGKGSFSFCSSLTWIFKLLAFFPFALDLKCFCAIKRCECSCCRKNSQLLILFLKEWLVEHQH